MDIASGPTVADPTTCADALAIIRRYEVALPAKVMEVLESGRGESVKPDDPRLHGNETRFIATPQMALEASAARRTRRGHSGAHSGRQPSKEKPAMSAR